MVDDKNIVPFDVSQLPAELRAEANAYLSEDRAKDLAGLPPEFPRVELLHAGANAMRIGGENGELVKSVKGIIVHNHAQNAWWEHAMDDRKPEDAGKWPECFSMDGFKPDNQATKIQSAECAKCPRNQYGSDLNGGRGKACKNLQRLFILVEGQEIPSVLTLPPTSLKTWGGYVVGLANTKKMRPGMCVTEIRAVGKKNKDNIEFTTVQFSFVRPVTGDEFQKMLKFRKVAEGYSRPPETQDYVSEPGSAG